MSDQLQDSSQRLDHSVRVGIAFGVTSGIITTLGLLVGLSAGTSSRTATLGGILTIAVADSLSDALGIHISEEAEGVHTQREIWTATLSTFLAKLLTALTFTIPVILVDLELAVVISIIWATGALTTLSVHLAHHQNANPKPIILEHLGVAALVVATAHAVGMAVSSLS